MLIHLALTHYVSLVVSFFCTGCFTSCLPKCDWLVALLSACVFAASAMSTEGRLPRSALLRPLKPRQTQSEAVVCIHLVRGTSNVESLPHELVAAQASGPKRSAVSLGERPKAQSNRACLHASKECHELHIAIARNRKMATDFLRAPPQLFRRP